MELVNSGMSNREAGRQCGVDEATVRRIKAAHVFVPVVHLDKKVGGMNWRDAIAPIQQMQKLHRDASWSQQTATIKVGNGSGPVGILCWGDQHVGARGTEYDSFVQITDLLLATPNLYALLTGDVAEWAIKMRGVAEVCAQLLDPSLQIQFIESWFDEIKHKVIASTWGNHTDDRSEAALGACPLKNIIAKHVPYFSGIGHMELLVGEQTYKVACSHKFSGVTALDSTAGAKKYLRMEAPSFDAAIQGDCHRAGVSMYNEGPNHRVAITNGTHHLHSGFAARYFSIATSDCMPVLALWPDTKRLVGFFNVDAFSATLGEPVA